MADKKQEKTTKTEKKVENVEAKSIIKKRFSGVVVSNSMGKTIVVKVDSVKVHPKYKKRFTVSKKYKVHDEKNQFKVNDTVTFVECRPLSKDKRWRVIYAK